MAEQHEELFAELASRGRAGAQEWQLWKHNPITEAFFAYLADWTRNEERWILEGFLAGNMDEAAPETDRNPLVMRGQILALRHLAGIDHRTIAEWYAAKRAEEEDRRSAADERPDEPGPEEF